MTPSLFSSTHIMWLNCPIRWIESLEYLVAKSIYLTDVLIKGYEMLNKYKDKLESEDNERM